MKNRWMLFVLLGWALLLAACSPLPGGAAETVTTPGYALEIQSVSVEQGVRVELMGTTTLPEGNCVYTQLGQDGEAVTWWPVGKCFPLEVPAWQIGVPLGVEGAPAELDPDAAYCIHLWWPGAPNQTLAEFDFDLAPPPAP